MGGLRDLGSRQSVGHYIDSSLHMLQRSRESIELMGLATSSDPGPG